MVLVGVPAEPHPAPSVANLVMRRRALAGSLIGGIPETQEMLEFYHQHGLAADIEMIRIQEIDDAYERMLKSDVKYRFVIDMQSLKQGTNGIVSPAADSASHLVCVGVAGSRTAVFQPEGCPAACPFFSPLDSPWLVSALSTWLRERAKQWGSNT